MTTWEIIRWWEIRRIFYNAILFGIGIASILGMEWLMDKVIPVGEDAVEPFALAFGAVTYGIMANICYSFGWIVEVRGSRTNAVLARARGRKLFLAGLWFSCVLTTAPIWYGLIFWLTQRSR